MAEKCLINIGNGFCYVSDAVSLLQTTLNTE